jgi:SWIM zinc finger
MATITPARKCSKGHAPIEAQLARYQSGEVVALSLTEPGTVYRLERTPSGWSCQCKGYQYRGSCYHAAAALERFGVPCWFCAGVEGVEAYQNPHQPNEPLFLCQPCAGH